MIKVFLGIEYTDSDEDVILVPAGSEPQQPLKVAVTPTRESLESPTTWFYPSFWCCCRSTSIDQCETAL